MLEIIKQAWNGLPIVIPLEMLTEVPNNKASKTNIYPTITDGIINIFHEKNIKSIKLHSITGTTLKNWSDTNTIDIFDQSNGFYLLQLFNYQWTVTTYMVIKQ